MTYLFHYHWLFIIFEQHKHLDHCHSDMQLFTDPSATDHLAGCWYKVECVYKVLKWTSLSHF